MRALAGEPEPEASTLEPGIIQRIPKAAVAGITELADLLELVPPDGVTGAQIAAAFYRISNHTYFCHRTATPHDNRAASAYAKKAYPRPFVVNKRGA